jgi:hypothetical protein
MAKPLQQDEEGKIVNDKETTKTQKGYANYEKEQQSAQKEMEANDEKFKQKIKSGVEKVKGVMGFSKGGSASSRADGCAVRGKTKGRMV